jgi:diguanylate cyclase (GGDEF)-like protein
MNRRATRASLTRELRRTRAELAAERHARRAAEEREAAKHYQATHDQLTGLLNRAGWLEAWPMYAHTMPAVAMLDLDRLKPVNDRYGHAAGDRVLQVVAARLSGASGCLPGRLGGDEFALYLPAVDAWDVAVTIASRVAQPVELGDDVRVSVTASIGVTTADGHSALSMLLAQADAASYRAKHTKGSEAWVDHVAVYDPRRDDHRTAEPGDKKDIRTRDLKPLDQRDVPAHPYLVPEVAR